MWHNCVDGVQTPKQKLKLWWFLNHIPYWPFVIDYRKRRIYTLTCANTHTHTHMPKCQTKKIYFQKKTFKIVCVVMPFISTEIHHKFSLINRVQKVQQRLIRGEKFYCPWTHNKKFHLLKCCLKIDQLVDFPTSSIFNEY